MFELINIFIFYTCKNKHFPKCSKSQNVFLKGYDSDNTNNSVDITKIQKNNYNDITKYYTFLSIFFQKMNKKAKILRK